MKPSRVAIALTLTAVCAGGVWGILGPSAPAVAPVPYNPWPPPKLDSYQVQQEILRALRRGDLHAAGRLNGGSYVAEFIPHPEGFFSRLEDVGKVSDLVVVGRAFRVLPRLTDGGGGISTFATISIERVIKGAALERVRVKVPGGRVRFDDGVVVELRSADSEFGIVAGRSYALFLSRVSGDVLPEPERPGDQVYVPTGASYGIFDLTSGDGIVKPQAPPASPVRKALEGERVARFLDQLPARALPQ